MSRSALLRAAVAPLLATAFGVLSVGAVPLGPGAATASADPLVPALAPAPTTAPGSDESIDGDRPVRIDVGRFEPRTVTPGAVITVTGTFTNTGPSTITDLSLRLQRGDGLTSRAELAALEQDPDPATTVRPSFQNLRGELPPGGELDFSYAVPAADLALDRDAVYPALLNLNGTVDGEEQRRVGELSTFVVQQPVVPAASTTIAWLWPLVEPSHRSPSGGFRDDGLTDAVRSGGRLDRALAVLERLPATVAAGEAGPVPALSVTLAIDPALVEELQVMAAGPYPVDGVDGAGRGTEEATAYLDRLRAVADDHPVVALTYGDVDADSLTAAGLADVLVRTLPGTDRGTAKDPPVAPITDGATASSPGGESASPAPDEDGDTGAGARILADALGVEPRTDLAWAAGGSLRADTLATMQTGGVDQVVLGAGGLSGGDAAVGLDGGAASAHTSVTTTAGPLDVLIADPELADVVGSAEQVAGGPRMAEQRYLAELAALGLQAPAGSELTVLVAPPRLVEAGPDGAGAMMADTTGLTWLRPGSVEGLVGSPIASAGDLVDAADSVPLDPAGMADVVGAVGIRHDLADAVVGNADVALADHDAALARATSAYWRTDPEGFRAGAVAIRESMDRLRGRVSLLAPVDGTYSLASSDAPLVLTVHNDLPFAVQVLLDVRTRGNRGLSIGDIGATTLEPGERKTLQVPTQVRQSGGFAVTAALTTPGGALLGEPVHMQVKSTAYGSISLLITFGAATLLGLLFLRRLVLFILRRRRAAAGADQPGTAPEGAGLQPPTRSPV
ncbi:MAG: DUF6049 family protein [Blastococcus sp.]